MAQIFIFGASSAYGVGGEEGGIGDLLKKKIHSQMYHPNGTGEKHEVYNFSTPGATVEFFLDSFDYQIDKYAKDTKLIAVVSVGMNNSKAINESGNFISSSSQYKTAMEKSLTKLKQKVDAVICCGYTLVDESKTTPIANPFNEDLAYFRNDKIMEFNKIFKQVCQQIGVAFIEIDVEYEEWKRKYLYKDGLHPNKEGHQLIFDKLWPEVEKLL